MRNQELMISLPMRLVDHVLGRSHGVPAYDAVAEIEALIEDQIGSRDARSANGHELETQALRSERCEKLLRELYIAARDQQRLGEVSIKAISPDLLETIESFLARK
jgi:hypothetical protein